MSNDENVALSAFQLENDGLEASNHIVVAFAAWIAIVELVVGAQTKLFRKLGLNLRISPSVKLACINLTPWF
jgi:hypothetical protein